MHSKKLLVIVPLFAVLAVWATSEPDAADAAEAKVAAKPAAGTGSAVTPQEADDIVAYHNKVRKEVGVGPVTWSKDIAQFAQEWADKLADSGELVHRKKNKYGENIAMAGGVIKGAELWYSEKKDYKAGSAIPKDFGKFKAGHYTQMVWRKTTEIGVGKALVKKGKFAGQFAIVGNYNPAGNVLGDKPY